jgi:hypothetical protein
MISESMVRKVAVAYSGSKIYIALFVYIAPVIIDNPELCCDMDMVIIVHIIFVSCLRPWITLFFSAENSFVFSLLQSARLTLGSSLYVCIGPAVTYCYSVYSPCCINSDPCKRVYI